jgi:tetratricopeptide (TPR) repeat protein
MAVFHYRQKGFPPIKIQASADYDTSKFAALLSAYLAQDTPDAVIVIPPGGHGADAAYPVEQLSSSSSWFRTAVRIALSAEPTFEVHVQYLYLGKEHRPHQATVRVTKTPRNYVVMATSVRDYSESELVQQLGSRISHGIHQTRSVLSHTPRWERWSADWEGYFKYRTALEEERHGNLRSALTLYNEAIAIEPGNFVISMRKGALLELMHNYNEAATVYRTCGELWQESIEARYRLSGALSNGQRPEEASEVLSELEDRWLTRQTLRHNLHESRFKRRNAGERQYWRGWLKRKPIVIGLSKQQAYRTAISVCQTITAVQAITLQKPIGTTASLKDALLKHLQITREPVPESDFNRLLHPEKSLSQLKCCLHCTTWHDPADDKELRMRDPIEINKPRSGIGWLAHYNSAVCFSYLIDLPEDKIPAGYHRCHWQTDCARAAILEMGKAKRDPRNDLEPNWYRSDPGLAPLRKFLTGPKKRWAEFVGLTQVK